MYDRIGPALRQARLDQSLSLRALAAAVGISPSQLSQIETGKSQPSVSTLYSLVSRLGLSLDSLLNLGPTATADLRGNTSDRSAGVIQRAADNPVLEMANGVRWERLAGTDARTDALRVTYQPGAASSADRTLMRHPGIEYAYLISGELILFLEFDQHVFRAGDSLSFDSTKPHVYVNRSDVPAVGVWFVADAHDLDSTRTWVASQLGDAPSPEAPVRNAVEAMDLLRTTHNGSAGTSGVH